MSSTESELPTIGTRVTKHEELADYDAINTTDVKLDSCKEPEEKDSNYNNCNYCGCVFKYGKAFVKHLNTHMDCRFSCDLCGADLASPVDVEAHARIHPAQERLQVYECRQLD